MAAFRRLHTAFGARRPAGPAGATDADESFTEGIGEVVAFVPVPPDAPGRPAAERAELDRRRAASLDVLAAGAQPTSPQLA